ncbi:MAG: FKBP-type peptidyl-prolyl cis-trans isomerase [Sterolibacterium sp.]|nr:FKBP-type peptidyl-prolyl cis-trans isomerase [Sterolibacterium sp.]
MSEQVKADSLVTLNYRVASRDGVEFIGTFDSAPAVLKLGNDELAPALERCLMGMAVGQRQVFELQPEDAFGPHLPHLIQRVPRDRLPNGDRLQAQTLLEFDAPNGARFTGLICEIDAQTALIDFNHPLAGKPVRFEAEIIGVI